MGIFPSDHSRLRGDKSFNRRVAGFERRAGGAQQGLRMLVQLPVLMVCGVSILLVGFILGYGVRAVVSRRRRAQARRRYEVTGSAPRPIGRRF